MTSGLRPRALLVIATGLVLVGIVAVLLGLDAAAEAPPDAYRYAVLIGSAGASLVLFFTAAAFVAVDYQRRAAALRAAARADLDAALLALAGTVEGVQQAVEQLDATAVPAPRSRRGAR
jgi:uncharacterized membrane protein YedE/YeeE